MSAMRRLVWLLALASSSAVATAAADPAPSVADRLDGCEGIPPRAKLETAGNAALHAVAGRQRFLVFPQRDARSCAVYPIGRAAARANGGFGGKACKAYALQPAECSGGSCAIAVAVRGKLERPLAAVLTDEHCNDSVALRPIKLFPGRDSLELVCHASSGAGWKERRVLLDVVGDSLVVLFSLSTGSYIALSESERAAGDCPSKPVGTLHVEKIGDKPVLRVVDPASGTLEDGAGVLPARQLIYDPASRTFVPTGAPEIPTKVDAQGGCRSVDP